MGINIYAVTGYVGHLWEEYYDEPYTTKYLVQEAFEGADGTVQILAKVLRERLPRTLDLVRERERVVYKTDENEISEVVQSFIDFVELCEQKEEETGEPVTIVARY